MPLPLCRPCPSVAGAGGVQRRFVLHKFRLPIALRPCLSVAFAPLSPGRRAFKACFLTIYLSLAFGLLPNGKISVSLPSPLCRRRGRHTFGKPQKYAKAFQRGGEKSAFYSWGFRPLFGFSPMVAHGSLLVCRPLSAPPEKALYHLRAYTLYPCALYCLAGV